MARKPGPTKHSPLAPLKLANDRLQMLEQAGLTKKRRAELLAKSAAACERIIDNPNSDPFAVMAAAKSIIRDLAGVTPSRTTQPVTAVQVPVVINVGDSPPIPRARVLSAHTDEADA